MIRNLISTLLQGLFPSPSYIPVRFLASEKTSVDFYWSEHTVRSKPFRTKEESLAYLEWRFEEYPLFRELMELWGDHTGQVLLDYGCGPGNDLVGFLTYSNPQKVIGIDVSKKALMLASQRLSLHGVGVEKVELIQISDSIPEIPLEDKSVDYIYCEGVLHHTSFPDEILKEFRRVLKTGGEAMVMVYNRNSIWLHLYTAYEKMIVCNAFQGLGLDEAFSKNTDGVNCPISRCYSPQEFVSICEAAGFEAHFKGGYLSRLELDLFAKSMPAALQDERLSDEHKHFLRALEVDSRGYPMYQGKYAGIGGVYHLS